MFIFASCIVWTMASCDLGFGDADVSWPLSRETARAATPDLAGGAAQMNSSAINLIGEQPIETR
jgi:hypothetical protein